MQIKCSNVSGHSECKFIADGSSKEDVISLITAHISKEHTEIMGDYTEGELAAMQDSIEESIEA